MGDPRSTTITPPDYCDYDFLSSFDAWFGGFASAAGGTWKLQLMLESTFKNDAFKVAEDEGLELHIVVFSKRTRWGGLAAVPALEVPSEEVGPQTAPVTATAESAAEHLQSTSPIPAIIDAAHDRVGIPRPHLLKPHTWSPDGTHSR